MFTARKFLLRSPPTKSKYLSTDAKRPGLSIEESGPICLPGACLLLYGFLCWGLLYSLLYGFLCRSLLGCLLSRSLLCCCLLRWCLLCCFLSCQGSTSLL